MNIQLLLNQRVANEKKEKISLDYYLSFKKKTQKKTKS